MLHTSSRKPRLRQPIQNKSIHTCHNAGHFPKDAQALSQGLERDGMVSRTSSIHVTCIAHAVAELATLIADVLLCVLHFLQAVDVWSLSGGCGHATTWLPAQDGEILYCLMNYGCSVSPFELKEQNAGEVLACEQVCKPDPQHTCSPPSIPPGVSILSSLLICISCSWVPRATMTDEDYILSIRLQHEDKSRPAAVLDQRSDRISC